MKDGIGFAHGLELVRRRVKRGGLAGLWMGVMAILCVEVGRVMGEKGIKCVIEYVRGIMRVWRVCACVKEIRVGVYA